MSPCSATRSAMLRRYHRLRRLVERLLKPPSTAIAVLHPVSVSPSAFAAATVQLSIPLTLCCREMHLVCVFAVALALLGVQASGHEGGRRVRRDSDSPKPYLSKMTTCVRNRFGSTSAHLFKQERCVYRHVKRALETRDKVSCKFCDR